MFNIHKARRRLNADNLFLILLRNFNPDYESEFKRIWDKVIKKSDMVEHIGEYNVGTIPSGKYTYTIDMPNKTSNYEVINIDKMFTNDINKYADDEYRYVYYDFSKTLGENMYAACQAIEENP